MSEQDYKTIEFHGYPIYSKESAIEGEFKRYAPMPTPQDVYNEALKGLPKVYPMTNEPIPVSDAESYLTAAVTHLEMNHGMNISPVTHWHAEDYMDGMFNNNYGGINLSRWPATKIISFQFKYQSAVINPPFATYTVPAEWIALKKNKVNLMVASGRVTPKYDNSGLPQSGIFFGTVGIGYNSPWRPNTIEVIYQAGFDHDKLPANMALMIKLQAAKFMLISIAPVLFPSSSVNVSIDGVSQSVGYTIPTLLQQRIDRIEKEIEELAAAFKSGFGKTVKVTRFGS